MRMRSLQNRIDKLRMLSRPPVPPREATITDGERERRFAELQAFAERRDLSWPPQGYPAEKP
jgi:hypothetical protein